jgi:hypothetical protein
MQARVPLLLLALSLASPLALGCANQTQGPEIASSASQTSYALSYPAEIEGAANGFGARRGEVKKSAAAFAGYPGELKDPNWSQVLEVIRAADQSGHSQAYVDRSRELEGTRAFFDAERDEIDRKVGGSAQYVAKKKGCDVELGGTVNAALKDAVDKQIDKRRREASEASILLERYKVSLGKDNTAALEKQSDEISRASYIVRIELPERKLRLARLVEEGDKVRSTMDDFVTAEKAFQADKKTTDPEKKASEERIAAMNKSKSRLDASITLAKALQTDIDKQIADSQKEYTDAFEALEKKVKDGIK